MPSMISVDRLPVSNMFIAKWDSKFIIRNWRKISKIDVTKKWKGCLKMVWIWTWSTLTSRVRGTWGPASRAPPPHFPFSLVLLLPALVQTPSAGAQILFLYWKIYTCTSNRELLPTKLVAAVLWGIHHCRASCTSTHSLPSPGLAPASALDPLSFL